MTAPTLPELPKNDHAFCDPEGEQPDILVWRDYSMRSYALASIAADRAAEGWRNFDLLMKITDWFIERDKLLTNRTEEADGPMAAALNIIDSIEALVAADRAATTPAADRLHSAIMNLPCEPAVGALASVSYKQGHRDASHAAAELVSAALTTPDRAATAPDNELLGDLAALGLAFPSMSEQRAIVRRAGEFIRAALTTPDRAAESRSELELLQGRQIFGLEENVRGLMEELEAARRAANSLAAPASGDSVNQAERAGNSPEAVDGASER